MMSFVESVSTCMSKYVTFSGRATRAEYWWFYLFTSLVNMGAMCMDFMIDSPVDVCRLAASFALLLPGLAVGVRRCHDTNHSGWWLLCPIYNLVLMFLPSDTVANDYGFPAA